ncbi:MAG: type II 3-dehydroquinate dehydratase [Clostridia bacterium]|nr:type II 3-dehydroquinate dehydratase [Clostridia bacterium]
MKILVINGPNINMLGIREKHIYGSENFDTLIETCRNTGEKLGVDIECYQSNHEGDLVDKIQQAYFTGVEGIVINPGAYTHTSIALRDALSSVKIPTVEVHISDVNSREDFRKISYVRDVCIKTISGHGTAGYFEAIDLLLEGNK